MLGARIVADLLTGLRASIAFSLPWLGYRLGKVALPLAVYLMLVAWISDYFDGVIARQSQNRKASWIGQHDLEVDMTASAGLLLYLLGAGFISLGFAAAYVVLWAIIFLRYGISKATGSLVQAPIYARFLWVAGQQAPQAAIWVLVWVVANLLFTWRRFAFEVLPEFFRSVAETLRREQG